MKYTFMHLHERRWPSLGPRTPSCCCLTPQLVTLVSLAEFSSTSTFFPVSFNQSRKYPTEVCKNEIVEPEQEHYLGVCQKYNLSRSTLYCLNKNPGGRPQHSRGSGTNCITAVWKLPARRIFTGHHCGLKNAQFVIKKVLKASVTSGGCLTKSLLWYRGCKFQGVQ